MIKTLPVLFAFLCFTSVAAQQGADFEQEKIRQTVISMFDALSNRDSVALKTYCTTDITLYEYGVIWNLDSLILKTITQNQSTGFKRTNRFDFIQTLADKKTGWVTYRLESLIIKEGLPVTSQWLETVVLVKTSKKWKIKNLHSTLIKRT